VVCCFGGGVAAGLPAWAIREVPLETRQGPSTYDLVGLRLRLRGCLGWVRGQRATFKGYYGVVGG
jgi:hypothetical protein